MFDNINEKITVNLSAGNTETFRALHRKLDRDYRPFLAAMAKKYPGPSTIHDQAKMAVLEVDATIDIFENALRESIISATVAEELGTSVRSAIGAVSELFKANTRNDEFTQKFMAHMDAVKKDTGIGVEALTVSEETVIQGEREAQATASKTLEMLKPLAPVGKVIKGVGAGALTAIAGPFAPMAELGASVLGTAGKKLFSRMSSGRGRKAAGAAREQIGIRAGEVRSTSQFGAGGGVGMPNIAASPQISMHRGVGPQKPMSGRGSLLAGMTLFYNKHAYTAKWTKDLLDTTKKIQKNTGGGTTLGDKFGGFGKALSGLAAKGGPILMFAAKLGLAGVALAEIGMIAKSWHDMFKSVTKLEESTETSRSTAERNAAEIQKMGLGTYLGRTGKSEMEAVASRALRRKMEDDADFRARAARPGGWIGVKTGLIKRKAVSQSDYERMGAGEIGALTSKQRHAIARKERDAGKEGIDKEELEVLIEGMRKAYVESNAEFLKMMESSNKASQLHPTSSRPRINTRDSGLDVGYVGGM